MRIAVAQLNYTIGAFRENLAKIEEAAARASQEGADLLVLSELATTGYPPRDLLDRSDFIDRNLRMLERIAALTDEKLGVLTGFVDRSPPGEGTGLLNGAALCERGQVVAVRHKCLLPTYDVFDEDRYFDPASEVSPVEFRGFRLGVTICEDAWNDPEFWLRRRYDRDPIEELVRQGVDLLINISASPFTLGKPEFRRKMMQQFAVKHRHITLLVNQVGGQDELVFDGNSLGYDATGELVFQARDFDEDFIIVDLSEDALRGNAAKTGARRDVGAGNVEEAYKALVLGVRDYTRKCGFSKAVLGLSGGIDSALTAAIATAALGPEQVWGVSMPSRYSSEHSKSDAAELARNLGIHYREIPIDSTFQCFLDSLDGTFAGLPADVTEENLQARIRGSVLMSLSNKFGNLLLTTGNKSELAVGYCTLYGDMCGGLAVISDVPKTLVYDLARFVNRDRVVIPESTLTKPPSAELAPDQTDQDTLPPYDTLDRILEAYVEQSMSHEEIAGLGIDRTVVDDVTAKIDGNEYKRRQAAPGIKITSKAFGLGRRFPVAADYSDDGV